MSAVSVAALVAAVAFKNAVLPRLCISSRPYVTAQRRSHSITHQTGRLSVTYVRGNDLKIWGLFGSHSLAHTRSG